MLIICWSSCSQPYWLGKGSHVNSLRAFTLLRKVIRIGYMRVKILCIDNILYLLDFLFLLQWTLFFGWFEASTWVLCSGTRTYQSSPKNLSFHIVRFLRGFLEVRSSDIIQHFIRKKKNKQTNKQSKQKQFSVHFFLFLITLKGNSANFTHQNLFTGLREYYVMCVKCCLIKPFVDPSDKLPQPGSVGSEDYNFENEKIWGSLS